MTLARSRGPSLALLALGMVLTLATWFSAAAARPGLRSELGLSPADERWSIALVQLAFAIGAATAALAGVADRVGPRRLAVVGALLAAAANAAPLVAPSTPVLLASRAAVGGALALVYPSLLRVAAGVPSGERGRVLGAMIGALTVGSALPHLVDGLGGTSWRALLATTSLAAVAGAGAILAGGRTAAPEARAPRVTATSVVAVLRSRPLRLTCAGYVGHVWELYAGWAATGPLLAAAWGPGRPASLWSFAVVSLGGVAAAAGGRLGDRVGRRRAAMAAMCGSAGLVVVVGFVTASPVVLTIVALAWGGAVIADGGHFPALVADHADPDHLGAALSLQLAAGFTATAVATWLVPLVQLHAGWGWAMAVLAPGPALGALALARLGRVAPAGSTPAPTTRPAPALVAVAPAAARL